MRHRPAVAPGSRWKCAAPLLALAAVLAALPSLSAAHGIADGDAAAVAAAHGPQPWVYAYLGAKHMVTGVDHLLFLLCVVGLLRQAREVLVLASLFALGHSVTLVAGTLQGWSVNEHAVDALIGLSIVWKALDNLGAFQTFLGWRPPPRLGVAVFGLVHGLGLASRVQALQLPEDHLLTHLLAFNAGVELGQVLALGAMVGALAAGRRLRGGPRARAPQPVRAGEDRAGAGAAPGLQRPAYVAQLALYTAGLVLTLEQLGAWGFGA